MKLGQWGVDCSIPVQAKDVNYERINAPKLEPDCCLYAMEKGKCITSDLMSLGGNQF